MRICITTFAAMIGLAASAEALTLKTGEVLDPDGEIYHGASPKEMKALIDRAQSDETPAGVLGNNVYVVIGEEMSEATGEDIGQLISDGGIEGLDQGLLTELDTVPAETGIKFKNLVAVNAVLESLPDDKLEELMAHIGDMIDEGFADEIDATLNELAQIEGALENVLNFDSLEECVAAGASNCEATAAIMDAHDPGDDDDDDE